jgi:DNA primase
VVEGPLDAIAVSLAGNGHTVGVATLGTALTEQQADLLRPYVSIDGAGVLVATDGDPAGQQAAERMFWQFTGHGAAPRRLDLPPGLDPADLLHRDGAPALRAAIDRAGSLADQLIHARIARAVAEDGNAHAAAVLHNVAAVIAALPPLQWVAHIDRVTEALHLPPGPVHSAVLEAGDLWTPTSARQPDRPGRDRAAGARSRRSSELPWASLGITARAPGPPRPGLDAPGR